MEDLQKLRNEIDEIDSKLVKLFERRMEVVGKVGEYKKKNNVPILNQNRENEVIEKNSNKVENKSLKSAVKEFFNSLMSISRRAQGKLIFENKETLSNKKNFEKQIDKATVFQFKEGTKVGFQGLKGSFSEQALKEYFGENIISENVESFEGVFESIEKGNVEYGVLPIENSSTGGIAEVYDLLRKYGYYIVAEKIVRVKHNLLAVKGTKLEDIKEVYSHPQAFGQSCEFLKEHSNWKMIPYYNTAISAKYIKEENSKSKAAIASLRAAHLYNLEILKEGINTNHKNYTRFIIIGKKLEIPKECNKISVLLSIEHEVGALYNVLSHFAENNLNMIKIESRPMKDKSWQYFFYIDFEGNLRDEVTREAVSIISNNSSYFKFLGNYISDKKEK